MIEVETTMQQQQQGKACNHVSPSPSFRLSSYSSSETLADIAARVIEDLRWDPHHSISDDEVILQPWENDNDGHQAVNDNDQNENDNNDDDDDDFEFTFFPRYPNASPVSADDIFYNGQIKPTYPIFGRTLNDTVSSVSQINNKNQQNDAAEEIKRRRPALRKLLFEERETASCSSSTDESVDLEGVAEGTYCMWTPHSMGVKERKKKISSTGSVSKKWKLRNLVLGSNSEGKEKVSKRTNKVTNEAAKPRSDDGNGGAWGRVVKDGEQAKRKSFLPYKQELVGLFTPVK